MFLVDRNSLDSFVIEMILYRLQSVDRVTLSSLSCVVMSGDYCKMSSSGTTSPLVAKDDEILENPIGEEEESLERNSTEENDSGDEAASASAVNPSTNDAAQIVPLLQNLLLTNDIQRERLTGLFQLYAPAAGEVNRIDLHFLSVDTNANVNTEEDEQTAREAALSSQVHFLEQSVQMLEEEVENQKKLNAQLEEQIKRLTRSSDPERQD
ncbi:hypothetical protein YC2023_101455 [Brassica napus]